jgi:hypothetical protein
MNIAPQGCKMYVPCKDFLTSLQGTWEYRCNGCSETYMRFVEFSVANCCMVEWGTYTEWWMTNYWISNCGKMNAVCEHWTQNCTKFGTWKHVVSVVSRLQAERSKVQTPTRENLTLVKNVDNGPVAHTPTYSMGSAHKVAGTWRWQLTST